MANNQQIVSIASGNVPIHHKLGTGLQAHVFHNRDLHKSLCGLSNLVDEEGSEIKLTNRTISVSKHGEEILSGTKSPQDRSWTLLIDPTHAEAHLAVRNTSHAELAKYVSAVMCNPADFTLIRALRNGWLRYPGINHTMVSKNPPSTIQSALGHMDLTKSNLQSTKPKQTKPQHESSGKTHNPKIEEEEQDVSEEDAVFTQIINIPTDSTEHSDATGRFPIKSISGNNYVLVSTYKGYIHLLPFKTRSAEEYVNSHRATHHFYSQSGNSPRRSYALTAKFHKCWRTSLQMK